MFITKKYLFTFILLSALKLSALQQQSPFNVENDIVCLAGICGKKVCMLFKNFQSPHLSIKSENFFTLEASIQNKEVILLLNGKRYYDKELIGNFIFKDNELYNEDNGNLVSPFIQTDEE